MSDFKISLAAARVNAEMTQQEAADAIGVNRATLVKWERGETSPSAALLYKLLGIYKAPIEFIYLPK